MSELNEDKKKMMRIMEEIAWLPSNNELNETSSDVRILNQLKSPAQKVAASRINSQREFNEAFEIWFDTLGFHDENKKNKIKISTIISHVTDVLEKNGIKY